MEDKEIKTVTLSGVISYEYDADWFWNKLKLIQEDGYKIDLVNRFQEALENYPNQPVQVNYWLSDKACSKGDMLKGWLKKISGAIDAEYQKNDYRYSSLTSGTDYDTVLTVGGHNLYNELANEKDRFILIEMNFVINNKPK